MRDEVFHTTKNFVLPCGSVQLTDGFLIPAQPPRFEEAALLETNAFYSAGF
jgi:hypothetical protein